MKKLSLLFSLNLLISCSHIQFTADGKIPVFFTPEETHEQNISLEVKSQYFLWGILPLVHEIKLDEVFSSKGYHSVADVKIIRERSFADFFWTAVSFGVYAPKTYVVEGKIRAR